MSKLKLKKLLTEKKPWQGYKAHAVHGKAEVDFLNLISGFPDWKKYNKLTDKGKNIIFFTKKDKNALVWQTSNGREVQATNLKGDESSYKSYRLGDIYKILIEGKLNEAPTAKARVSSPKKWYDNFWNASGQLLDTVYWLSSIQGRAPDKIKKDAKLKRIIDGLKKLERQLDKWYDKTDVLAIEGKLNEGPKVKKGDIKKGKFVWFEDGKNSAVRVKVKNIVPSKDGKEEHYVTNKGTFTADDVVGY